ncbi:MAG: bifunctional ADP-dependent NAD(P)H-hydrate dehydratase/NAD(P)H-hydrate epimerase [Coxiella sp. (in: Bacteria)]|nr:MAG: bifunctional ADP-dependent NAD(P)H-hydrate dehydratase/NAD(P)H-hydrate epimerase [Coxiella sp. (in: g-proteobacteria)]
MTFLYTNAQVRELEALTISEEIDSDIGLMNKAGLAAFNLLKETWPEARTITVVCGKGNNGGDGFVVGRLAQESGFNVTLYTLTDVAELKGAALEACNQAHDMGVAFTQFHPEICFSGDVIIDAVLGSGLKGTVEEPYATCIDAINASELPVLALDVPSGIDVDTGAVLGTAVRATITITFIALKQGLFTHSARARCGEVVLDSLEVPNDIFTKAEHAAELLTWDDIKVLLPRRKRDAHKGDYGHVLVIGGDYGMGGAVRMAAESAMRIGAGLVTVATRPEHISVVSGMRPEAMCHSCTNRDDLLKLIENVTTIVIGPGLGKTEWAQELLATVLESDLPKVLDADALNLLGLTPRPCDSWVLTPHPGEAARLLHIGTNDVQSDRFQASRELQHQYDGVIVLKGSGTIIEGPSDIPYVCSAGNPGMATGGMGDILSGMIGGLLAQGLELERAAEAGVFIHSKAADKAAEAQGERGLLATDVLKYLPELINPYMNIGNK